MDPRLLLRISCNVSFITDWEICKVNIPIRKRKISSDPPHSASVEAFSVPGRRKKEKPLRWLQL